jgi:hypothetical protein
MFPNASLLAQYIDDFSKLYNINVKTNTSIQNINCIDSSHSDCDDRESKRKIYYEKYNDKKQKHCSKFEMDDQHGNKYVCQ